MLVMLSAEDAFEAVTVIPGSGGLDILLDAMSKAGAPEQALTRVRDAADEFERMIELHTGDRNMLELVIDSAGASRPMELSRKLAFKGNSGVWGIQARARVTAHFMAPNVDDPSMLDLAMLAGLARVRRLRPVARWPVFQVREYNDDGSLRLRRRRESLKPSTDGASGGPAGAGGPGGPGDLGLFIRFVPATCRRFTSHNAATRRSTNSARARWG